MEMKSLLLIINPVAGRGTYKNGLGEALHVLHSAGYVPTVRFTTRAGEAVDLAAQSAGYDMLCCMGFSLLCFYGRRMPCITPALSRCRPRTRPTAF